ncbi:MAG: hypothetical protein QOE92_473, partial [Chloroflexota bacterium]|nr:hypothetical protein [Chloroflexota bacterium]
MKLVDVRRRVVARVSMVLVALGAAAFPAAIGTIGARAATTNCAGLQAALDAGGTVTLSDTALCTGSYTITVPVVLQGADANQGFDGSSHPGTRVLGGADAGAVTIEGLTFQDSSCGAFLGGAIMLGGDVRPRIINNRFYRNSSDESGGAVALLPDTPGSIEVTGNTFGSAGNGNSASGSGGALFIAGTDPVVSNNTFTANTLSVDTPNTNRGGAGMFLSLSATEAGHSGSVTNNSFFNNAGHLMGGGATIEISASPAVAVPFTVAGNTFRGNSLLANTANFVTHLGGGLLLERLATGTTTQSHNVFDGNVVTAPTTSASDSFDYGGGGEFLSGGTTTSLDDTFLNNRVETG